MADAKASFAKQVSDNIIKHLEQGTAPWQRPWSPSVNSSIPFNPTTGARYKGVNILNLMCQGHSDPRWMTYRQAAGANAQVKKGAKSTLVQYWKFFDEKNKLDENGKVVKDENGKPQKIKIALKPPKPFYSNVFNAEQIDGLPELIVKEPSFEDMWENQERAEKLLAASGATIKHDQANRAFYSSHKDSIHLPTKEQFDESNKYYATALHELGHWTGHKSRLDRDLANPFGSEAYAKEELRAEIGSMMLGDTLGVGHDPSQHVAYVESWIKALKNDPQEIFRAASAAEKIQKFLLDLEKQREIELTTQKEAGINLSEDAAATWINLKNTAKSQGFTAELTAQSDAKQPYLVSYSYPDKEKLPVLSYVNSDGSTLTDDPTSPLSSIDTTSDLAAQKDILLLALTPYIKNVEQVIEPKQPLSLAPAPDLNTNEKIFLTVPYKDKDAAKALGAKWDNTTRHWSVPKGTDLTPFSQWPVATPATAKKHFLAVPYDDRKEAKGLGAKWDRQQGAWYVIENDKNQIPEGCKKWLIENQSIEPSQQIDPREEFADKLFALGFEVGSEHPIMDGKKHRCRVDTDKGKSHAQGSGMYVADTNGHPWGYAINNRTGVETKWKAKGITLTPEEKAKHQAIAAKKQHEYELEKAATQAHVAAAMTRLVSVCVKPVGNELYITNKDLETNSLLAIPDTSALENDPDIAIGNTWQECKQLREKNPEKLVFKTGDLLSPAINGDGDIRSIQTINAEGVKMFPRGGQKTGTFCVVGGDLDAIAKCDVLMISEGHATADAISKGADRPVVSAFDASNMVEVAKTLHEKFPTKPVVIFGDDDRHLSLTEVKGNVGRHKAELAAELTNGKAIFPTFAPQESTIPLVIADMTPQQWRGTVTTEQKEAVNKMKGFTDFNDLKMKSELGKDGVTRQVNAALSYSLSQAKNQSQTQAKTQTMEHDLGY